jgi:glycosyltransferase involved in cell wall biosynthesis
MQKADGAMRLGVSEKSANPLYQAHTTTLLTRRIKVGLLIRNFRIGGTERQVLELAKHLDRRKFEVVVIALRGDGDLKAPFHSLPDSQVVTLEGRHPLQVLFRLMGVIRKSQIQVVHSFGTATNIYSLLAGCFSRRVKVIIGLRDSLPDFYFGHTSPLWRSKMWMLEFCLNHLCGFGDLFVSNSEAGKGLYEGKLGVRVVVVPNGIDTDRFRPDPAARGLLRGAVGAPPTAKLVGILANCSIYKDYPTFVRAAKIIADRVRDVHFISIGEERTVEGAAAKGLVRQSGLEDVFHFLGTRRDVPELLPGFDVMCSSSVTEGFPNAIVEAMACGVPCVVTDVGDSRKIVGDAGIVVFPKNPESLATGVAALLNLDPAEKERLCSQARKRVVQNFDVAEMANEHAHLYASLLSGASLKLEIINPSI